MPDTTPLIGSGAKNKHELVIWSDPFQKIWAGFTRSTAKKVTFDELMERGPKEQVKVMKSIVQMMKQLSRSPIDEVEMLLVLLALYKTSDVVQVKWHRTERGQTAKATYKEAKEAFLRNGVIDEV